MTIIGALAATVAIVMADAPSTGSVTYSVDDCVRIALESNASITQSEARVREYQARLEQVETMFATHVQGLALAAPMYTVRGNIYHYENAWKRLSDWGPFAHLVASLARPLYTFGRKDAATMAASERAAIEQARLRETQNVVAWETRKLYYTHLYAKSLLPSLAEAGEKVKFAIERAQEIYASGSGEVSQSDVARLQFAMDQIRRFSTMAEAGAQITLAALKHTMGLVASANLVLADTMLPALPDDGDQRELASYLADASVNRPEWQQLAHGKAATKSLASAESKANLPMIGLAAQLELGWSPTRDNATNPYVYDPYNMVTGLVALGAVFDLNPWTAEAKRRAAMAQYEQLEALERFAATGIPLQVRNAWMNLQQARDLVRVANESMKATRTWVTFAASAYDTGTGEPRDLLDGLAALMESRRMLFDALRDYYLAVAELAYTTGTSR